MIEKLEPRQLLAVSLSSTGRLTITGTSGDDVVVLKVKNELEIALDGSISHPQHLLVKLNGQQVYDIRSSKVKRIIGNLLEGNDSFAALPTKGTSVVINGGPGNDTITGGSGNDSLDGAEGNDELVGLNGNDVLGSAFGSDNLQGGDGIDTADFKQRTAALNITLDDIANDGESGQTGNVSSSIEIVVGGAGADLIDASFIHGDPNTSTTQNETLIGNGGKNTLIGGDGDDELEGGVNNDSISGGLGNDTLIGNRGRDHLNGDAGTDLLIADDDNLRDTLDGGAGLDVGHYDFMDRVSHL